VCTNDHGCAAASAITPGNDDGQVNDIGFLVGSDVGGEVGCQVGSVVGSNVGSSSPLYWDSPEAAKLFGFSYQDGDDVHKGVQDIITLLTRAQQSHDGYKHFVANIDQAPLTPIQIFRLKPSEVVDCCVFAHETKNLSIACINLWVYFYYSTPKLEHP
jgi:hypothetical protein